MTKKEPSDLELHYQQFMQDIFATADAEENFHDAAFVDTMCGFLEDQGFFEDFNNAGFRKNQQGIRIDAWTLDRDNGILTLFIADFKPGLTLNTLTETEIEKCFRRLEKFVSSCSKSDFINELDESIPVYSLVYLLYHKIVDIWKMKLVILSNSVLSHRLSEDILSKRSGNLSCPASYEVWDMGRHLAVASSLDGKEDILIDCTGVLEHGIPCLPGSSSNTKDYCAYLLILPGSFIAGLYEKYLERLLEQNVRTFLQFRGKINKGIRNTIVNEPHMFFAYNNGLTATAEEVTVDSTGTRILAIKNLQIVNGGQTTASIYTAQKDNRVQLNEVYVQMKLTVIPPDQIEEVVPRISEYANTQNKVNAADFFSNHPFHLRIQEISRKLVTPASKDNLRGSYWYYERTRGQYNNAMAGLTQSQKHKFIATYPKNQMFTKTDLAKFVMSWEMRPNEVSLGAQKCFARFSSETGETWEKRDLEYNDLYFKELIAKAILFRFLDREIMKQEWYGGYKANIVTYSIAKLRQYLQERGLTIDLIKIWNEQGVSMEMKTFLLQIAKMVDNEIKMTPLATMNVTEWCKKTDCWESIRKIRLSPNYDIKIDCMEPASLDEKRKQARNTQKTVKGINNQVYVVEQGAPYWSKLVSWIEDNKYPVTELESSVLSIACQIPRKVPTEGQSKTLIALEKKTENEGFYRNNKK